MPYYHVYIEYAEEKGEIYSSLEINVDTQILMENVAPNYMKGRPFKFLGKSYEPEKIRKIFIFKSDNRFEQLILPDGKSVVGQDTKYITGSFLKGFVEGVTNDTSHFIASRQLRHVVYGIDTPLSMGALSTYSYASGTIDLFDSMIGSLDSMSSRNPSVFVDTSPIIDWMKVTKEKMIQSREKLVVEGKSVFTAYEKSVQAYGELINNPNVKEPEIQDFFEENPSLIDLGLERLFPKKSFGGERFPDFIAVLHDGKHVLIEIETPTKRLYTSKGNPTTEFKQAEQQILDYLQWANEEKEFLRKRGLSNISVENTSGLLIIGMSKNLSKEEKRKLGRKKFECKNYEIKTFDELLSENHQVIDNIRKYSKTPNKDVRNAEKFI